MGLKSVRAVMLSALLLAPVPAAAQVAWDGPFLMPPRQTGSLGIYLTDMEGGGLGAMATWRSSGWNYGLRAGISEGADEDLGIFGGIDFSGTINRSTDEFPLDIDWVLGAGLGVADGIRLSAPLGLSVGHTFPAEGAIFTPWLTPRVFLDARFGRDDEPAGEDDTDVGLGLAADLGLDLRLNPGRGALAGLTIRFGASFGDREAFAIGVVF